MTLSFISKPVRAASGRGNAPAAVGRLDCEGHQRTHTYTALNHDRTTSYTTKMIANTYTMVEDVGTANKTRQGLITPDTRSTKILDRS